MCGVKESVRIDSVRIFLQAHYPYRNGLLAPLWFAWEERQGSAPIDQEPGLVLHEIAKPIAHKVILCSDAIHLAANGSQGLCRSEDTLTSQPSKSEVQYTWLLMEGNGYAEVKTHFITKQAKGAIPLTANGSQW